MFTHFLNLKPPSTVVFLKVRGCEEVKNVVLKMQCGMGSTPVLLPDALIVGVGVCVHACWGKWHSEWQRGLRLIFVGHSLTGNPGFKLC